MRPAFSVAFALTIGAFTAASCDDEESIEGLVDEIVDERNMQIDLVCGDCSDELGYASRGDCEDAFGFVGPSKRRCVQDAYARDEGASKSYLNCLKPLEEEYTACSQDRLDCDDASNSIAACNEDYMIGRNDCIELPQTVENALEDCFPASGG